MDTVKMWGSPAAGISITLAQRWEEESGVRAVLSRRAATLQNHCAEAFSGLTYGQAEDQLSGNAVTTTMQHGLCFVGSIIVCPLEGLSFIFLSKN